jgi:hypothetical protein
MVPHRAKPFQSPTTSCGVRFARRMVRSGRNQSSVQFVALLEDAVNGDVWRPLRRRVAVFTAAGGPLLAAYVITHSSTVEGVVVGAPLLAAGGFAIGALVAGAGRHAVERLWIALALVAFAVVASVGFTVLDV